MNTTAGDGFFSRWSRRKAQARSGETPPDPGPAQTPQAPVAMPVSAPADAGAQLAAESQAPASPPPTLEDTQALTPASDFSRFVARDVPSEVRNAAVKKLFADPHFNVMDGLDIYIDDYSKPSPLSAADMARMVSAQFLKLVDEPEEQTPKRAKAAARDAVPGTSADPPSATENTRTPDAEAPTETHDDHADLQLQPDHAPGPQGPGPGAG